MGFWKPLATIVVLLYSIIFWFNNYLATLSFGMEDTILKGVTWIISSAIIIVGAIVVDWASTWVDSMWAGEEIWEGLGKILAILVSIIFWFTWLGTLDFTAYDTIQKAVTWIVITLILTIFPNVLGFLTGLFEKHLPTPK